MKILIATATKPKSRDAGKLVFDQIRKSATEGDLSVKVCYWTTGRGCTNLAVDIDGDEDEIERFANVLTMALMPSKWTTTSDDMPEVDTIDDIVFE